MTRRREHAAVLALALCASLAASPARAQPPDEPEGYRLENYRAPTPATLRGAKVLATAHAQTLWREGRAVFIDVLPQPQRPANLPPATLWRTPPHDSIPGAVWLPNVGYGEIAPETDAYFRHGLDAATHGDLARPLVFFCLRDCWMSWNAAKRAMGYGYAAVHWYPDGTDGWRDAGLPLERIAPAP